MKKTIIDCDNEHLLLCKLTRLIDRYIVKEKLYQKRESLFNNPHIEFLTHNFAGIIGVIDFQNKNYPYVSSSCEEMFGYSPSDFKVYGLALALKIFRAEHSELFVREIHPTIFEVYQAHTKNDEAKRIKVSYTNEMKMKDGSYKWMLHQLTVLESDESGMPVLILKMVSEIDGVKRDDSVDFVISKKNNQGIYKVLLKKTFFRFTSNGTSTLTTRENEILQLVSQGLSGKQIAANLFISEYTVYTHKKNMLKKFELDSSSQLVKYAIANGMIL